MAVKDTCLVCGEKGYIDFKDVVFVVNVYGKKIYVKWKSNYCAKCNNAFSTLDETFALLDRARMIYNIEYGGGFWRTLLRFYWLRRIVKKYYFMAKRFAILDY